MIEFVLASMMAPSTEALPPPARPTKGETRYCRDMVNASSRTREIKVCRTRAEWRRWEACHASVTRYCTPKKKTPVSMAMLGRETAFPLNENSRIVCRMVYATGSRLAKEQICLPQREWERMWKESAEGTWKLQDQSTRARDLE